MRRFIVKEVDSHYFIINVKDDESERNPEYRLNVGTSFHKHYPNGKLRQACGKVPASLGEALDYILSEN